MIEDNNHIISTNGIKILSTWLRNDSTTNKIPNSYPLLFVLSKFKSHSTHPINTILYEWSDSVIIGGRLIDLMQALADGLGSNKGNVKYGSAMICLRITSVMLKDEDLFY